MRNFNPTFSGLLAVILATAVIFAACAGGKDSERVMTINDEIVVTKAQYDEVYNGFIKRLKLDQSENKSQLDHKVVQEQLKQMTLDRLIFNALLEHEAKKHNIRVTDQDVERFKQENLDNIGGYENLKPMLQAESISEKEFHEQLRDELLIKKFIEETAGDRLTVSEAEARNFFEQNPQRFDLPKRIRASHILFKVIEPNIKRELQAKNPKISREALEQEVARISAEKKSKAEALLKEVRKNPEKFAELARQKSEDQASAVFGGDLDWLYQPTTDATFWSAALATPAGQIHPDVVKTPFGYHVIRVEKIQEPHKQTFDEAKDDIIKQLSLQRKQEQLLSWVNEQRAHIRIDFAEAYKPEGLELQNTPLPPESAGIAPTGKSLEKTGG